MSEIEDMKNEIEIIKTNLRLLQRIKTKTITDEIRKRLMSVKYVYNKYDKEETQGYSVKQIHKLLDEIEDDNWLLTEGDKS